MTSKIHQKKKKTLSRRLRHSGKQLPAIACFFFFFFYCREVVPFPLVPVPLVFPRWFHNKILTKWWSLFLASLTCHISHSIWVRCLLMWRFCCILFVAFWSQFQCTLLISTRFPMHVSGKLSKNAKPNSPPLICTCVCQYISLSCS